MTLLNRGSKSFVLIDPVVVLRYIDRRKNTMRNASLPGQVSRRARYNSRGDAELPIQLICFTKIKRALSPPLSLWHPTWQSCSTSRFTRCSKLAVSIASRRKTSTDSITGAMLIPGGWRLSINLRRRLKAEFPDSSATNSRDFMFLSVLSICTRTEVEVEVGAGYPIDTTDWQRNYE
jgi:hypothetical protein